MTLVIKIKMDNAAFDDGAEGMLEAKSILSKILERMEDGDSWDDHEGALMDTNGNTVGRMEVVK